MELSTGALLALAGFGGGAVLGVTARVGRFCAMGALEDWFLGGDTRRLRAWALAIAVAMAATQVLAHAGLIDLSRSVYLGHAIPWSGAVVGGLMFGLGMALVGTCGFGTLARIGGGDLRAVVTFLVMGVSAYMAMGGITGLLRRVVFEPRGATAQPAPSLDALIDRVAGLDTGALPGLAVAVVLGGWALGGGSFRQAPRLIWSGVAVGLAIAAGWLVTARLGADPFAPQKLESFTFVRPLGDAIVYLMTFSGAAITFGIGSVFGVIAGAFAGARLKREFRWEACDDVRELRRHLIGAFLMGTGGILAYGCTVGQGLSAASALSLTAPVTIMAIALGSRIGIAWLVEGDLRGVFARVRLAFGRQDP
jgi:uncharacterized membrane protein YedE/YeeE